MNLCNRILVVDDDPFQVKGIQIILGIALNKLGYSDDIAEKLIDSASDGQEAVEKVISLQ